MAGLVNLKKADLANLMVKDAQRVIDVWHEWNNLFTEFCEKSEASEDREGGSQELERLRDIFFRILNAIWLASDYSPVVAKYRNDEVDDLARHFSLKFDFGLPYLGEPARWHEFQTLQKRLMEDLDNYQDEVLLSKEMLVTTPVGDASLEADKTVPLCKWSDVRTFSEWQNVLQWPPTTWARRRNAFPESFQDVKGENTCRIRESDLNDWLASAKNKTNAEQIARTAAEKKSQKR